MVKGGRASLVEVWMLGREDPQKTLLEVELWAGRAIVPADSFYGRFARVAPQLVSDDTFVRCYGTTGRPSVSPALLTKVLLLALHDGCSDRRAVEQMRMHLGWKLALGIPLDEPGCHPTTLTVFRARLVVHDLDRELFTQVVRKAVAAGLLARNAVQLVDSSAILGAGAVQDTYTLLRKALSRVIRAGQKQLPDELRPRLERYIDAKKPEIDWDDVTARRQELGRLVADARAALAALPDSAAEGGDDEEFRRVQLSRALLEQVLDQDVEDGGDARPQLKQGVSRHRMPSITDPEMQHGRKSAARKWSGYKQHITTDPETELVTAVVVSPASAGDGSVLPELLAQQEETGLASSRVVGDQAYGGGALREQLAEHGVEVVAKVAPIHNGDYFSKDEFVIDLEAGRVRCPAGQIALIPSPFVSGQSQRVDFPVSTCLACPLHDRCVRGSRGRSITIGAYEGQRQRARMLQREPAIQVLLHRRPLVERKLAHLVRWGGRKARYLGLRKTTFQLLFVGLLANLDRLSRLVLGDLTLAERLAAV
jgi:IS5 family transposase